MAGPFLSVRRPGGPRAPALPARPRRRRDKVLPPRLLERYRPAARRARLGHDRRDPRAPGRVAHRELRDPRRRPGTPAADGHATTACCAAIGAGAVRVGLRGAPAARGCGRGPAARRPAGRCSAARQLRARAGWPPPGASAARRAGGPCVRARRPAAQAAPAAHRPPDAAAERSGAMSGSLRLLVVVPFLDEAGAPAGAPRLDRRRRSARPTSCCWSTTAPPTARPSCAAPFAAEHRYARFERRPPGGRSATGWPRAGAAGVRLGPRTGRNPGTSRRSSTRTCASAPDLFAEPSAGSSPTRGSASPGPTCAGGPDGTLRRQRCPADHVEGATSFYRRACLEPISPLPPILGWDTIDEVRARMRGWRTRGFELPAGDPVHLRRMGSHDGVLRGYRRAGLARPTPTAPHPAHLLAAAAVRMRDRPRLRVRRRLPRRLCAPRRSARAARRAERAGTVRREQRARLAARARRAHRVSRHVLVARSRRCRIRSTRACARRRPRCATPAADVTVACPTRPGDLAR